MKTLGAGTSRSRLARLGGIGLLLAVQLAHPAGAVEGLSSGKCVIPWARTLEPGVMELESALEYAIYDHGLDAKGNRVRLDGTYREFGVKNRITAGLAKRLEMGVAFGIESQSFAPRDGDTLDRSETALGDPALGWKYRILGHNGDDQALALEGGIGLPLVSKKSFAVWEAGLIYTRRLVGPLTMDVDGTYWLASENSPGDPEVGSNFDLGLGLELDGWILAGELNGFWFRTRGDHEESWKVTPTAGFAYEVVKERFCVTLLGQQDVPGLGRNTELASAVKMLFTFHLSRPA